MDNKIIEKNKMKQIQAQYKAWHFQDLWPNFASISKNLPFNSIVDVLATCELLISSRIYSIYVHIVFDAS